MFVSAFIAVFIAVLIATACIRTRQAHRKPNGAKATGVAHGARRLSKSLHRRPQLRCDAKPFRIESTATSDGNGHDGKVCRMECQLRLCLRNAREAFYLVWQQRARCSSRGVSPGNEDVYNPRNASTQVFDVAFLNWIPIRLLTLRRNTAAKRFWKKSYHSGDIYLRLESQYE